MQYPLVMASGTGQRGWKRPVTIQTCPTDLVRAPAERVWELLTIPREFANWSGTRLIEGPARLLAAGDCFVVGPRFGSNLRIYFDVLDAKPPQELAARVRLPFGVVNQELVRITPAGPDHCRVTFN